MRGAHIARAVVPAHGAVGASVGSTVVVALIAQTTSFTSEILAHSPGSRAASPPRSAVNSRAALDELDECVGWTRVERS